jgi:hypothetical protein
VSWFIGIRHSTVFECIDGILSSTRAVCVGQQSFWSRVLTDQVPLVRVRSLTGIYELKAGP